jgi:hypothetical protein
MSGTIDFAQAAKRLGRPSGKKPFSAANITQVERVLDHATQLHVQAKDDIRNVVLVLEESAARLRRIASMLDQPTAVSISFGSRLAEIEQLLRIAHDKVAHL